MSDTPSSTVGDAGSPEMLDILKEIVAHTAGMIESVADQQLSLFTYSQDALYLSPSRLPALKIKTSERHSYFRDTAVRIRNLGIKAGLWKDEEAFRDQGREACLNACRVKEKKEKLSALQNKLNSLGQVAIEGIAGRSDGSVRTGQGWKRKIDLDDLEKKLDEAMKVVKKLKKE